MSGSSADPSSGHPTTALIHGSDQLIAALAELGIEQGEAHAALVFAPSGEVSNWEDIEAILLEAYRLSREGMNAGAHIVYAISGSALYGHTSTPSAILATALLGGARSLAAEGQRKGIPVHAITVGEDSGPAGIAATVAWLLRSDPGTGQTIHQDTVHVGRPPV